MQTVPLIFQFRVTNGSSPFVQLFNNPITLTHNPIPNRCVTFRDDEHALVDLVDECMVCFWLYYISLLVSRYNIYVIVFPLYVFFIYTLRHFYFSLYVTLRQKGHPLASSNACQLLLKYILLNRNSFIKAYHNRVYSYSSGTKFLEVTDKLERWMGGVDDARAKDPSIENPKLILKRFKNVRNLHAILGDYMIDFMRLKPEPYLRWALASKENFWEVPEFKRAMTAVFLVRYMLGYKTQHMWKKFTVNDLKLNKR